MLHSLNVVYATTLKRIDETTAGAIYASIESTPNGELVVRDKVVQDYPDLMGADVDVAYLEKKLHYHSRTALEKFKLVKLKIEEIE